jgi:hypothetical protein
MGREEIQRVNQPVALPVTARIQAGRKRNLEHLEVAARAELEARAGRRFSDAEWISARSRLIELMRILRAWRENARSDRLQPAETAAAIVESIRLYTTQNRVRFGSSWIRFEAGFVSSMRRKRRPQWRRWT